MVEISRRSRRQYARDTNRNRASLPRASSPRQRTPYGASLSFETTTHLRLPSDPPSRKPTDTKPQHRPAARSIPGRALASSMLGSLSGPQDRTSTSDLNNMPDTLAFGSALSAAL